MNVKSFFVAALSSALDLGIATSDDVLRHVTPDVLATHLPRPLWARLLTACVGAPRVDAQLVVETIGVPNLCEHVPTPIIWSCIEEIATRALGRQLASKADDVAVATPATSERVITKATPAKGVRPLPLSTPPPPEPKAPVAPTVTPAALGPNIPAPGSAPLTDVLNELESEQPARARTTTSQRFRQTNTNIGRLAQANQQRRPQAQATVPSPPITPEPSAAGDRPRARRGETEGDFEIETDVSAGKDDWKTALAVEDEQLVDWSSSEETMTSTSGEPRDGYGRKR